jgi:hypothetical protein
MRLAEVRRMRGGVFFVRLRQGAEVATARVIVLR